MAGLMPADFSPDCIEAIIKDRYGSKADEYLQYRYQMLKFASFPDLLLNMDLDV